MKQLLLLFTLAASLTLTSAETTDGSALWRIFARLLGLDFMLYAESSNARSVPVNTSTTGDKLVRYDLQTHSETILWSASGLRFPTILPGRKLAVLRRIVPGGNPDDAGVWLIDLNAGNTRTKFLAQDFATLLGVTKDEKQLIAIGVVPEPIGDSSGGTKPVAAGVAQTVGVHKMEIKVYAIELASGFVRELVDQELQSLGVLFPDALNAPRQGEFFKGLRINTSESGEVKVTQRTDAVSSCRKFGPNDPANPATATDKAFRMDPIWLDKETILYVKALRN